MSFRTTLIVLNIVALAVIAGVILWRVFSLKRDQEPTPANLTKYLEDEAVEAARRRAAALLADPVVLRPVTRALEPL